MQNLFELKMEFALNSDSASQAPHTLQTLIDLHFGELNKIVNKKILESKNRLEAELKSFLICKDSSDIEDHRQSVGNMKSDIKKFNEDINEMLFQKVEAFTQKLEIFTTDIEEIFKNLIQRSDGFENNIEDLTMNKLNPVSVIKGKPKGLKNCFEVMEKENCFVMAEENGIISLWNSINYKRLFSIKAFNNEISSIKYVQKFQILYSSSRNKIKAYRLSPKKTLTLIKCFELANTLGFMLPLGEMNKIVTSEGLKTTSIRCLKSFKLKGELSKTGYSAFFITKYNLVAIDYFDGLIGLCDIKKARELSKVESGHKFSSVLSWGFCPSKNFLFAAMNTGNIRIWSLSFDGFSFFKERTVPKISGLIYHLNHQIIFSSCDRALWNYCLEEHETTPLIYTDIYIKDFKIDFKNKLLFSEQAASIHLLKFR